MAKRFTFSYGRKRIVLSRDSSHFDRFSVVIELFTPKKRRCDDHDDDAKPNCSSQLEALPLEILIKVICGVDHDDLKQLFHVSETVRNATQIARQMHFSYSTPSRFTTFGNSIDVLNNWINYEAPNAPKLGRKMNRTRICREKLRDLSVVLFGDEEQSNRGARRSLFVEANN